MCGCKRGRGDGCEDRQGEVEADDLLWQRLKKNCTPSFTEHFSFLNFEFVEFQHSRRSCVGTEYCQQVKTRVKTQVQMFM